MAIYLEKQEKEYLIRILTDMTKWWVRDSIISKLSADDERLETMESCKHEPGTYLGKKTCCTKCGSFYSEGMFESWELTDKKVTYEVPKWEDPQKQLFT